MARCELRSEGARCSYPYESCDTDLDCSSAPGGVCIKRIRFARCVYDECGTDTDCGSGRGCECLESSGRRYCVPANCATDSGCGTGQTCGRDRGCCGGVVGRFCTTPNDTCEPGDPQSGDFCSFANGAWHRDAEACTCGE